MDEQELHSGVKASVEITPKYFLECITITCQLQGDSCSYSFLSVWRTNLNATQLSGY